MKTRLLTLTAACTLVLLLVGAFYLSNAETPLTAVIKFDPNNVDMDGAPVTLWNCEIKSPSAGAGWAARDIDPSTILFEHYIPIMPGSAYYAKGAMNVQFDGQAVWNAVLAKVGHMGIPPDVDNTNTPVMYYFTVSGYLTDGRYFEGQGWIKVRFPMGLPPPPPPPL
jgi:hypothetical protein